MQWSTEGKGVRIQHQFSRDAVFVATKSAGLRNTIEARRQAAMQIEKRNRVDEELVKALVK